MNLIQHVAIIMDGNGRWGIKKRKSRNYGHQQGLKSVELIIKQTIKEKIKFLTLYAFSTENWKRPKREINFFNCENCKGAMRLLADNIELIYCIVVFLFSNKFKIKVTPNIFLMPMSTFHCVKVVQN